MILEKKGLGCSSVVQHLPSKHEALGSIPSAEKEEKKKSISDILVCFNFPPSLLLEKLICMNKTSHQGQPK